MNLYPKSPLMHAVQPGPGCAFCMSYSGDLTRAETPTSGSIYPAKPLILLCCAPVWCSVVLSVLDFRFLISWSFCLDLCPSSDSSTPHHKSWQTFYICVFFFYCYCVQVFTHITCHLHNTTSAPICLNVTIAHIETLSRVPPHACICQTALILPSVQMWLMQIISCCLLHTGKVGTMSRPDTPGIFTCESSLSAAVIRRVLSGLWG